MRVFNADADADADADGDGQAVVVVGTFPRHEDESMVRLAARLGRPLWYLRPPVIGNRDELERVEQWLAHFRAVIAGLPLRPPYWFLGYSFGGVLALELARGYRAGGVAVDHVGLIDTWRPELVPRTPAEKAIALVRSLERAPRGRRAAVLALFARRSLEYRAGQARHAVRVVVGSRASVDAVTAEKDETVDVERDVTAMLQRAVKVSWFRYEATPIDFRVSVLACREGVEHYGDDPSLGWSPFLRAGFDTGALPGTHKTLFSPDHIDETALAIRTSLVRTEAWLHAPARLPEAVPD